MLAMNCGAADIEARGNTVLAERSPALPRVADDGCAFKALRPHPHAGQAGGC